MGKRKTKISKSKATENRAESSTLDVTLPDGNFLDSFDKFIAGEKKNLKDNRVLKKEIRVSFNRDSSVEISESSICDGSSEKDVVQSREICENMPLQIDSIKSVLHDSRKIIRRKLRPVYCYKGKQNKLSDEINASLINIRVERMKENLHDINTSSSESVFGTPVSRKRRKKLERNANASPIFDIFDRLATSTPAHNEDTRDREFSYFNEYANNACNLNLTATPSKETNSIPKELFASKAPEIVELTDTINSDECNHNQSHGIYSVSNVVDSSVEMRKDRQLLTKENRCTFQLDSYSKNKIQNDFSFENLVTEEAINICGHAENDPKANSNKIPSSNGRIAPLLNVPKNYAEHNSTIELASNRKIQFDTSSNRVDANTCQEFVIKSGKWRRTVYDIRNKIIQSPKRLDGKQPIAQLPKFERPSANHRKSIFLNNISKRKRNTLQNEALAIVLDESDVESNCSADFSPKQTPINALSEQRRSSRFLQPIDRISSQSRCELIHSTSIDPVVDEIVNLTSDLHLGYNQKAHLLRKCGQTDTLPFDEVYSKNSLKNCRKIGEGVFGEVFLNQSAKSSHVLKIIPIEGIEEINGAQQKRFDEILQEVIITQELSALRYDTVNRTAGFVEVLNVRLVEGRYPLYLLTLWNAYKDNHGTENESPGIFGDNQLYVVFELANCGLDLEAYDFKNAEQSYSAFKQAALSLAVAESKFEFEHRDLHWGNILVLPTTERFSTFLLNGKPIKIPSHGVKVTIIDYTLSRILYKDCCLYQDLSADPELFEAAGDYQYDIYRLMKSRTKGQWETFEPFTNVLWLHYAIDKMIDGVRYSSKKSIKHRTSMDDMMKLRDELLVYKSATDYAETNY